MKEKCDICDGELIVFGINLDHEDTILKCQGCGQLSHDFNTRKAEDITENLKIKKEKK